MRNGINPTTLKPEKLVRIEAFESDSKKIKVSAAENKTTIAQEVHETVKKSSKAKK